MIIMVKLLLDSCIYRMVLLRGFNVLSKDTFACGQEEPGVRSLTLGFMDIQRMNPADFGDPLIFSEILTFCNTSKSTLPL